MVVCGSCSGVKEIILSPAVEGGVDGERRGPKARVRRRDVHVRSGDCGGCSGG